MNLLDSLELHLPAGFSIVGTLGSGASAHVFLAESRTGEERLVVKVMRPGITSAEDERRFLREMHILNRLDHPRIPRVLSTGFAGESLFFTMPFLGTETLRDRLQASGRLEMRSALSIAHDIADALVHAHGRGVVHGDIKPANVLLGPSGAYLLDFGLATAPGVEPLHTSTSPEDIAGTPDYMSPEQAAGARRDARSDLYSLGVVVYEMLAGRRPFGSGSALAVMRERSLAPEAIRLDLEDDIPARVRSFVRTALHPRPTERFANALHMRHELDLLLN